MAKKILIVDDEKHIILLLKTRLERANYEVITAYNGKECIEKLVSERPDLIILDIMMPVMDGYSTLIAMKEMRAVAEEEEKIPVIVLSARADSGVRELVEQEEIVDYVLKPFKADQLMARIKEILKE
ncbi:MAG: response regulator [Candidatus Omnitrophota bacterium]